MLRPCFYLTEEGLGEMFNGPLSDRIDCITDKPQGESRKKPERRKSSLALLFIKSVLKSKNNQEVWESTQVSCPIPPRSPDQWY